MRASPVRGIGRGANGSFFARRIRRAMRAGELTLHYQPVVDCATGETRTVEALARWNRPAGDGVMQPSEFLPQIEESQLLEEFNDYVLAQAIGQAAGWRRAGIRLQVAVNVPIRCLRPHLLATLIELLGRNLLPTRLLELEITEGPGGEGRDVAESLAEGAGILERIRELGVSIALDDFGTAHSNLARLVALPIDGLKIDRSFVIPMLEDPIREEVVSSTIGLARRAGLWVVAEGVETGAHMRRLRELGADSAQGYWLARPMPPEELVGWLERQPTAGPSVLVLRRHHKRRPSERDELEPLDQDEGSSAVRHSFGGRIAAPSNPEWRLLPPARAPP